MSKEKNKLINEYIDHYNISHRVGYSPFQSDKEEFSSYDLTIGLRSVKHVLDTTWHIELYFSTLEDVNAFLEKHLKKILNVSNIDSILNIKFEVVGDFIDQDYKKQFELEQKSFQEYCDSLNK